MPTTLGGGLILVQFEGDNITGPLNGGDSVITIDPGTGDRTTLGAIPGITSQARSLQWAPDRSHILVDGGRTRLASVTEAGQAFTFVCCLPESVDFATVSPTGDRIAGLHRAERNVAGIQGTIGVYDAVVLTDLNGDNAQTLALPPGSDIELGWSWSRDGTSIVVAGCRPCVWSGLSGGLFPRGVVQHDHLYVVPVDGSPVRDLLDETTNLFMSPTWSPDGSVIAVQRTECLLGSVATCTKYEVSLVLVAEADARITTLATAGSEFWSTGSEFSWSPDGTRVAVLGNQGLFVMAADGSGAIKVANGPGTQLHWSPDGQWLLFAGTSDLWIVPAAGGEPRSLGSALGHAGLDW